MTPGIPRLIPFLSVSLVVHVAILIAADEQPRLTPTGGGSKEAVSVRLVPAGPAMRDPAAHTGVAGSRSAKATVAAAKQADAGRETSAASKPRPTAETATTAPPESRPTRESESERGSEAMGETATKERRSRQRKPQPEPEPEADTAPTVTPAASPTETRDRRRQRAERTPDGQPPRRPEERGDAGGRQAGASGPADGNGPASAQAMDAGAERRAATHPAGEADPSAAERTAGGANGSKARAQRRQRARAAITSELSRYFHYPRLARQRGWEGRVVLGCRVHADGRISDPRVVESSGRSILDAAALESLRRIERLPELAPRPGAAPLRLELPVTYRLRSG